MEVQTLTHQGQEVAAVQSWEPLVTDEQSALDLLMSIQHQTGCNRIILNKEAVSEDFFTLRTGLAGAVLQKVVTYRIKLAVYGNFTQYPSKALRDFIRESNRGRDVFFVNRLEEAVERLARAQ